MIRLREIALPPEHNVVQLQFEAARMLKGIGLTNAYYYKQRMPIPYAL